MDELLQVGDLRTHFFTRDGVVRAVDGVSFSVGRGRTLGVVGESGSGKTVTALSILRLVADPPGKIVGGDVLYQGSSLLAMSERDIRRIRGDRIAMVFQDPMTSLNPVYRVGRQIAEPLRLHRGMGRRDARRVSVQLLSATGIANAQERSRDYPHQFSGGMRQRAMIAMALACEPDILIADEPTTALDATVQAEILDLLRENQARTGLAMIMITHDLGVVADVADNVLVLYAGKVVELGSAEQVFHRPLHPYTWGLLGSSPRLVAGEKGKLVPIEGTPPSLVHLPGGCAFHPRCTYARDICRVEQPSLMDAQDGHLSACHFSGVPGFLAEARRSPGGGV